MTSVSVLIPAYRPDWLDICIASCLCQSHEIHEILIGDDCPDDGVRNTLKKWTNSKIQVFENPTKGVLGSNRDMLVSKASGEFIKFVFDDDFLLPNSVAVLVDACTRSGAAMAAHRRYMVDSKGIDLPFHDMFDEDVVYFDQNLLFNVMVNVGRNWIGEPSNVLMHRDSLEQCSKPFNRLDDCQIKYNTDMACYLNLVGEGRHGVCLTEKHSCFRTHPQQNTNTKNNGGIGWVEFDVMRRVGAKRKAIAPSDFVLGLDIQRQSYEAVLEQFPPVERFLRILDNAVYEDPLPVEFMEAMQETYWF